LWARDVDRACGWHQKQSEDFMYERALLQTKTQGKQQGQDAPFFKKLDIKTRRRIYYYVFDLHPLVEKSITLSMDFATKDVFHPGHFLTPGQVLRGTEGGLNTSRRMRDELMAYFWNTYKFHVTFSPFTLGPTFSGLSIKWLNLYADQIGTLTVEIDLSKRSLSASSDAHFLEGKGLDKTLLKFKAVIEDLVKVIRRREGKNYIKRIHLMVRRYDGFRPLPMPAMIPLPAGRDPSPEPEPIPKPPTPYGPFNRSFIAESSSEVSRANGGSRDLAASSSLRLQQTASPRGRAPESIGDGDYGLSMQGSAAQSSSIYSDAASLRTLQGFVRRIQPWIIATNWMMPSAGGRFSTP
jgi:hypothetical protein